MRNILLTGVGGQGTVLAAKILAAAYEHKGRHVRTAETLGMAQRGGSVVSFVRMADPGKTVFSPVIPKLGADLLISFEPAEGVRMLPYLKPGGTFVTATTAIQPVTAALARDPYTGQKAQQLLRRAAPGALMVDDAELLALVGNPKALNIVLLTVAQATGQLDITVEELKEAIADCVKPKLVEMNLQAVDTVREYLAKRPGLL